MINFVFSEDDLPQKSDRSLYNLLKIFGKVKVHSADNLPSEKFVFEYVQNWNDPVPIFFGSDDIMLRKPPPLGVLDRVRNGTAYLIFTMATESPFEDGNLDILHRYFSNLNLPIDNLIYFSCSPNMNALYQDWCKSRGFTPSFTLEYSPYYSINTTRYTKDDDREYVPEIKKKTFLSFNRRWSAQLHRVYLMYFLAENNMLENSYMSFSKTEIDSDRSFTDQMSVLNRRYLPSLNIDNEVVAKVESLLPLTLDLPHKNEDLMYSSLDKTVQFYKDSFVNITTETYFFSDIIHITEKSFKPIRYKQPFIIMGAPGFLAAIRNLGFKTFSSLWDESYDLEKNHEQRIYKISSLLKHLYQLDDSEKLKIMTGAKDIVEYNYRLIRHMSLYFLKDVLVKYKP